METYVFSFFSLVSFVGENGKGFSDELSDDWQARKARVQEEDH